MPLEDIDGNLIDADGNLIDTDTYTSNTDTPASCSAFAAASFKAGDQVKIIGTTLVLTIVDAIFVMTKYGTYEVSYKVSQSTQNGLILEKLLVKL